MSTVPAHLRMYQLKFSVLLLCTYTHYPNKPLTIHQSIICSTYPLRDTGTPDSIPAEWHGALWAGLQSIVGILGVIGFLYCMYHNAGVHAILPIYSDPKNKKCANCLQYIRLFSIKPAAY